MDYTLLSSTKFDRCYRYNKDSTGKICKCKTIAGHEIVAVTVHPIVYVA